MNKNSILPNYKNKKFKLVLKNIWNYNEHYYIEEKCIKSNEGIIISHRKIINSIPNFINKKKFKKIYWFFRNKL